MVFKLSRISAFVGMLFLSAAAFCQQVDSVTINGEKVYVYPFKVEFSQSYYYSAGFEGEALVKSRLSYDDYLKEQRLTNSSDEDVLTRDEFDNLVKAINAKSYRVFSKYYSPKFGPKPSKEEFKRYLKAKKGAGIYGEDGKSYMSKKKFQHAVRSNPYPFMFQRARLSQDITPMLDPIPDGKYIQYYEKFCWLTEEGDCKSVTDQIAGYFTIKNNVLDGEASWIDIVGDTIKHGYLKNGLKIGTWKEFDKSISYFDEYEAKVFAETGVVEVDTVITYTTFANGVENGAYSSMRNSNKPLVEGFYLEGEPSGEWIKRWSYTVSEEGFREDKVGNIREHYTVNSNDSLIVHPKLIRSSLFNLWDFDEMSYNFYSDYDIPELPVIYEPAFPRKDDLDLSEEAVMSEYEMSYDYYGYDDYYYYEENWDNASSGDYILDPNTGEYISRRKVYDSLGAYPNYMGTFEAFYPNGQLAYKFEFEGGLAKEDPVVYWDNGKIHDQVTFDTDSNRFERTLFDYDGLLVETITYDSLGAFLYRDSLNYDYDGYEIVTLDGITFEDYGYSIFEYTIPDSVLELGISGSTTSMKGWNRTDSTIVYEQKFDPETLIADTKFYSVLGGVIGEKSSNFGEDYGSWTGTQTHRIGDFEIRSIRSASLKDWAEIDSIPILMLNRDYHFNVDQDHSLYFEGQPLTGPMKIDFKGKKMKLSKTSMTFPVNPKGTDYLSKVMIAYREKGKVKNKFLLENLPNDTYENEGFTKRYNSTIPKLTSQIFANYTARRNNYDWEGNRIKEDKSPRPRTIEGYFLDGKPQGEWKEYDQYGKLLVVANFEKGELNGTVKEYAYQEPLQEQFYYMEEMQDTLPEKRTYYLQSESDFTNGMLNGKRTSYDWLGRVVSEEEFKDGYQDGISLERNDLAVSISEYQNGYLDGYSRTYLTFPGEDSILLYDLNFQNGALQGESKSYHTNGNISKRGFFLSGDPIEDYEGYDSLGFLYHYVKFEYSFPVEEKLWEENELSVKYQFDWQDSIEFIPMNFTQSESLDALLVKAGLSRGYEYQPYYGRQTIVDKSGVDYYMTKYYPNDTVARAGNVVEGKKSGYWEHFNYDGQKLYEVNYFDSLIVVNDSIKFNSKGVYTGLDLDGNETYCAYIIEKSERFDCSHKDHYEVRQLYTSWQADDSVGRMNELVYNYYDNGTLQSYGKMKDGLPHGEWRYYDPVGKLNKYGNYFQGKRNGRWLSGDLSKTKYLGDICLNPNMPDLEDELRFRENFIDIQVINYKLGKALHKEYYDINMNEFVEYDENAVDETEQSEE